MNFTTEELIVLKKNETKSFIIQVIGSIAMAFFLLSIFSLLNYNITRNYYDLTSIVLKELLGLFPLFLIFLYLSFFIVRKLIASKLELILAVIWVLFLLIFAYYAPVKSLVVGAIIFALPAIYGTISENINAIKQKSWFNRIVLILNSLMFFGLVYLYHLKSKIIYIEPEGLNGSQISNDIIYAEVMQSRWKIAFMIFAGVLLLYLIVNVLNGFFNFLKKKPLLIIGYVIVVAIIVLQVYYFSAMMVYRVKILNISTYDFGIFSQMFYNMRSFNGMVTTLERSIVLSHNAVHFSPIYYLMLPAFMIFPTLETLQILQVLIIASGVIPLYLIMKEFKTNKLMQMLVYIIYIASPALITSGFYDLHENCFLPPLLLFVIYFLIKGKIFPLIIFAGLTLLVKEDAGLYLVFIGLYFLFSSFFNKEETKKALTTIILSIGLIVVSLGYFYFVTKYLNEFGDGAMFWRYRNINAYEEFGLYGIILSAFQNPSFFLATFFSPAKINTMILILATTGFLPLFMKNKAAYFLAIPAVIMNYLSIYQYQYQFGYQYFFGSATLLIFMVLLAEKDNSKKPLFKGRFKGISLVTILAIFGSIAAMVHSASYIGDRISNYQYFYSENQEMYDEMRLTLESIPKDKRVVATGYLTPYLSDRFYLYDYFYYDILTTEETIDYIIIDLRIREELLNSIKAKCEWAGFVESDLSTDYILIYEPGE